MVERERGREREKEREREREKERGPDMVNWWKHVVLWVENKEFANKKKEKE